MAQAVITQEGLPVRITTIDYTLQDYFFFDNGKLGQFKINGVKYVHCYENHKDLVTSTRIIKSSLNGYYNYEDFLAYKAKGSVDNTTVKEFVFDPVSHQAVRNDTLIIQKRKITDDFSNILWVKYEMYYDGVALYPGYIDISVSLVISQYDLDYLPIEARHFYQLNYALAAANATTNLPNILADSTVMVANSITGIFPEFSTNTLSDQVVISIVSYWNSLKFTYDPADSASILEATKRLTAFYNALEEFRITFLTYKNKLLNDVGNSLINILIELAKISSAQAFEVVDVDTKIEMLLRMTKGNISQGNQLEFAALTVVESVTEMQGKYFLESLIITKVYDNKVQKTLFQLLFESIDDDRTTTYTFGLLSTLNNRLVFIFNIYQIWKKTVYNPSYASSDYTLPPYISDNKKFYPESYYLKLIPDPQSTIQKSKFYNPLTSPLVLLYESKSDGDGGYDTKYQSNHFHLEFDNSKIIVKKVVTSIYEPPSSHETIGQYLTKDYSEFYGKYEFYQPVINVGFKGNLNLLAIFQEINEDDNSENDVYLDYLPVFFLFYMEDYDERKDTDASIMLVVDMALNFIGIGALSKLRFLKYLSKFGSLATATAEESVLFWDAVSGVNNTVQFLSGQALALNNYIYQTTNDQDIQAFTGKVNIFLGALTLGSLSVNNAIKARVISAADDVITDVYRLNSIGKSYIKAGTTVEEETKLQDAMTAILNISGNKSYAIAFMQNRIADGSAFPGMLAKFNAIADEAEQYKFYQHFFKADDAALLKLNADGGFLIEIWQEFKFLVNERRSIEVLEAYKRFQYEKPWEFNHVTTLYGLRTGGHSSSYLRSFANPTGHFQSFSPPIVAIEERTTVEIVNGHQLYRNIYYENPNGSSLINNITYSKKTQYIVNPEWTQQHLLEEMSYAWASKKPIGPITSASTVPILVPENNNQLTWILQTDYRSTFTDGTKIEFTFRNWQKDPTSLTIPQPFRPDHLGVMKIVKKH
jgi:hypothetical protein